MIIDEGFLSNAKKISETQPQQSEVKVPVIKRENWEYKVLLEVSENNDKKTRRLINSCEIFKETSELIYDRLKYTFGADLFITTDTAFSFLYKAYKSEYIQEITFQDETGTDVLDIVNSDIKDFGITLLNINDRQISTVKRIKKITRLFTDILTRNAINTWLRNRETVIIDTKYLDMYYLYRIYIENTDCIYNILKKYPSYMIKTFTDPICRNYVEVYNNGKATSEAADYIIKTGQKELIIQYDYNNPAYIIQSTKPMRIDGTDIYAYFRLTSNGTTTNYNYNYLNDITNEAESLKLEGQTEPIHIDGEEPYKEDEADRMFIITAHTKQRRTDDADIAERISHSKLFIDYESIKHKLIRYKNDYTLTIYIKDAQLSRKPNDIYDMLNILSSYTNIEIDDRRRTIPYTTEIHYMNKKYKNMLDSRTSTFSTCQNINSVMMALGVSRADITKWNIKNNVIPLFMDRGGTFPIFIDDPEEQIPIDMDKLSLREAATLNIKDIPASQEDIKHELNKQDMHKFALIGKISTEIILTTLYPMMYKGEYVYPEFTKKKRRKDTTFKELTETINTLEKYEIHSEYVSKLIFADIEGNIRATGKDKTK